MIKNRLIKNLKRLKSSGVISETNAYRVYDRDIPEYPFMADLYGNILIVHDRRNAKIDEGKNNLQEFFDAIKEVFPELAEIKLKKRQNQDRFKKYEKLSTQQKEIIVFENDLKFIINTTDYIDVGLLLDHRPLRRWIKKESQNKNVLNLFSYTCSISAAAAIGGAKSVTSIDLSKNYLDWGKRNFELNNIELKNHSFVSGDILKELPFLKNSSFDLIICDPPTFSNSKKMEDVFDVQESQDFLINECLKKLTPSGKLYFSCNKRDFKLNPQNKDNEKIIFQDLTNKSIPPDFNDKKIHQCFSFEIKQ